MQYQLVLTAEQAQALWQCIMHAPLPRALTDDLAAAFRSQVETQNREREAKAKTNGGHDASAPQ